MGQEILQIRKSKFGKISGKKLSSMEDKILLMHTDMQAELAEASQNIERENMRRRGKKLERLGERNEGEKMQDDAEEQWERMILCVKRLTTKMSWMSGGKLASSTLDEQRKWVGTWKPDDDGKDVGRGAWEFWQDLRCSGVVRKDVMGDEVHERDAESRDNRSDDSNQVSNINDKQVHAVEDKKILLFLEDKNTSIHGIDKFKFKVMFGRQEDTKPRSSEMQEAGRDKKKKSNTVAEDQNPEKTLMGIRDARARPVVRKDAARATDAQSDRERSPWEGGRVKKKQRCTPGKIKKISRVSALKLLFEQENTTSSPTRGPAELPCQLSQQIKGINFLTTATTTKDAELCVSQSGGLTGTGPRQQAIVGTSTSQDWPRHARVVTGGPIGDALLWAGGEEQGTVCTDNVQTVQK